MAEGAVLGRHEKVDPVGKVEEPVSFFAKSPKTIYAAAVPEPRPWKSTTPPCSFKSKIWLNNIFPDFFLQKDWKGKELEN